MSSCSCCIECGDMATTDVMSCREHGEPEISNDSGRQQLSLKDWTVRASIALSILSGVDPLKATREDRKHFDDWAESLSEGPCNFYVEGYSPEDAAKEELS